MIRHLFFLFVVGPVVLFIMIGAKLANPEQFLQEFLEAPWWVQVSSVAIGVGGFVESLKPR